MDTDHYTHPHKIVGPVNIFGKEWQTANIYVMASLLNIINTLIFYVLVSSISFYFFYVRGSAKFTPKRMEKISKTFYHEQKLFDFKLSIANILISTPLITAITMLYPKYSKVQYQWQFSCSVLFYLILHIAYDEFMTYWLHRLLHHPSIFKYLHLEHHKSISITPFSGFALHPIDGFIQALPVFTSCFFIPIPLDFIVIHIAVSSLWVISVHDNINMIPFKLILYAGSHTIHHQPWGQRYNYGKITSICDRLFSTYIDPKNVVGYGYKANSSFSRCCDVMNEWFEKIVPDLGREKVQRQILPYIKKYD